MSESWSPLVTGAIGEAVVFGTYVKAALRKRFVRRAENIH